MTAIKSALVGARALRWAANRLVRVVQRNVEPDEAAAITGWLYDRATRYTRSATQNLGLHDFEAAAVAAHFPPPPAKLLVLGCGGGREVLALLDAGYTVIGSDPAARLVAAANEACNGRAHIEVGSIESAASLHAHGPFDGVVVGWGAWGYVLSTDERVAALRAIAAMCPGGPVLLSWPHDQPQPVNTTSERNGVPGQWTRRAANSWRDDLVVNPGTGFSVRLGIEQIRDECARAGYVIAHDGTTTRGYAHVVIRPEADV